MPLDEKAFEELAREIAALNGISEETAQDYLARIGDTPEQVSESDPHLILVRDDAGAELARIQFPIDAN